MNTTEFFGTEKIGKILCKLAPPVMLAQLIQALYNIVDSLFVGRYSASGLTELSIIYPLQLFPTQMLRIFTADEQVIAIGRIGFRFVGVSFLPMVTSLIFLKNNVVKNSN